MIERLGDLMVLLGPRCSADMLVLVLWLAGQSKILKQVKNFFRAGLSASRLQTRCLGALALTSTGAVANTSKQDRYASRFGI